MSDNHNPNDYRFNLIIRDTFLKRAKQLLDETDHFRDDFLLR